MVAGVHKTENRSFSVQSLNQKELKNIIRFKWTERNEIRFQISLNLRITHP